MSRRKLLPKLRVEIDARELATILHALRVYEDGVIGEAGGCGHFDEHPPLTTRQVNRLCERLDFAEVIK
jgi:hypothetical protein